MHRQKTEKSNTHSASGLASGGPNERASGPAIEIGPIHNIERWRRICGHFCNWHLHICGLHLSAHCSQSFCNRSARDISNNAIMVSGFVSSCISFFFFSMSCGFDVNFDSIHFLYKHKSYVNCHAMVIIENHENTVCKCFIYIALALALALDERNEKKINKTKQIRITNVNARDCRA